MYLLAICLSSLEKCLFRSSCFIDWVCLFIFSILSCMSCLCILEINPCGSLHLQIFSPSCGLSFRFVDSFLCCAKAFKFNQVHLFAVTSWSDPGRGVAGTMTHSQLVSKMLRGHRGLGTGMRRGQGCGLSPYAVGSALTPGREGCVTGVHVPRFFASSQQRFGVTDIKAPSASHSSQVLDRPCYSSQVSNGPCYSSQTNQCYSSILFRRQQENPSLRHEGTSI